jgi:hypothetical protein
MCHRSSTKAVKILSNKVPAFVSAAKRQEYQSSEPTTDDKSLLLDSIQDSYA